MPSEFSFIRDYDGAWINSSGRSEGKKTVYLTFDAGYENGNVAKILDVLKEKQVPAAFFILINLIESNPDLVKRMVNEGHTVCNHTAHHKDMTKITNINDFENELEGLNTAYKNLTGTEISKYYRPPEGKFTKSNLEFAKALGYKTVFWSFAYADWDNNCQPSEIYAKKKIMDNVHNGAVILLHPTSATNAAILGEIIDEMRIQGYEFGTLDELYEEITQS
ncbi:MAG: polysaccharide deacetylase family protein [Eubacteriales bacterium]